MKTRAIAKRVCLSCGQKCSGEVCRPRVITSVQVEGEKSPRQVFYVRREMLFDPLGRVCHSADSLGIQLANALNTQSVEAVDSIVWEALSFVHNGDVPVDWLRKRRKEQPVPIAI